MIHALPKAGSRSARGPHQSPGAAQARLLALAFLLVSGFGLATLFWLNQTRPPLESSLSQSFQLLGKPVHLLDRLASRVIPVGNLEERDLGETFHRRFSSQLKPGDRTQAYLDQIMLEQLRPHARRPFAYRAYRIGAIGGANAFALPGGAILISDEMLERLNSEAELVAILAHEIGHIELRHCFDRVRVQLLLRRGRNQTLGELADAAIGILLQSSYSKAAENEADHYSFNLLLNSPYDPSALGEVFKILNQLESRSDSPALDPLRDYLSSHPPGQIRAAEFSGRAGAWWANHPTQKRYTGRVNLERRETMSRHPASDEWVTGTAHRAHAAR